MLEFTGIFNQQSEVAGGAFPTVVNVTVTYFASSTTPHAVNFPATTTSGNLLLLIWTNDGSSTSSTPTDFSLQFQQDPATLQCRAYCFTKIATGSEGGGTINIQTTANDAGCSHLYQISGWGGSLTDDVESATLQVTSTTTPACPALTPSFGSANTLWIATIHRSDSTSVTAGPTDFTDNIDSQDFLDNTQGQLSSARRFLAASTLTPSGFTRSASSANAVTSTIAVKGT